MQGKIERLDARCEGGEHREEGGQTDGAERSRNYAAPTASTIDSTIRRY